MMKRTTLLISALCMLILANILMMSFASPAFLPNSEGFLSHMAKKAAGFADYEEEEEEGFNNHYKGKKAGFEDYEEEEEEGFGNSMKKAGFEDYEEEEEEAFEDYEEEEEFEDYEEEEEAEPEGFRNKNPAGAKDQYQPIGSFDGVRLQTGNSVSDWRYTSPNEQLQGNYPKFEVGADQLFMFKDNQVKPECCGASYSSYGGCVCTTPEQRNYINMRGGNRTGPDAGV
jgi:hypothetical protein